MNGFQILYFIFNGLSILGLMLGIRRLISTILADSAGGAKIGKISGLLLMISLVGTHINLICIEAVKSQLTVATSDEEIQRLSDAKLFFLMQSWQLSKTTSCTTTVFYVLSVFQGIYPLVDLSGLVFTILKVLTRLVQQRQVLYWVLGIEIGTVVISCIVNYKFYWITFYVSTVMMLASMTVVLMCPVLFTLLLMGTVGVEMRRSLVRLLLITIAAAAINTMSFVTGHLVPILRDGWIVNPADPYTVTGFSVGHFVALLGCIVCFVFIAASSKGPLPVTPSPVKSHPSTMNLFSSGK